MPGMLTLQQAFQMPRWPGDRSTQLQIVLISNSVLSFYLHVLLLGVFNFFHNES